MIYRPRRTLHECVDWNVHGVGDVTISVIVALYTSAWIEISLHSPEPLQCGVALYTSAWIEIVQHFNFSAFHIVALYTSAWIEINKAKLNQDFTPSRTLHECVDWNTDQNGEKKSDFGRTLHECVDWNNRLKVSQR